MVENRLLWFGIFLSTLIAMLSMILLTWSVCWLPLLRAKFDGSKTRWGYIDHTSSRSQETLWLYYVASWLLLMTTTLAGLSEPLPSLMNVLLLIVGGAVGYFTRQRIDTLSINDRTMGVKIYKFLWWRIIPAVVVCALFLWSLP